MLTSSNVNHTNCFDYIWNEVEKMSDMRSFVANMWYQRLMKVFWMNPDC